MANHLFAVYWNTPDDAQRANSDPLGFCSCNNIAFEFLKIPATKEFNGVVQGKSRKAHERTNTRADGSTIKARTQEGNAQSGIITVSESIGSSQAIVNMEGALSVTLVTGKKTTKGNYHTLTFRFTSSVARTIVISEALGEIIPANKMSSSPGQAEIYNWFKMPSGKRHIIMAPTRAEEKQNVNVGNATELLQILTAKGKNVDPGAGGDQQG